MTLLVAGSQGHVGQIRITRRKDVSPASYGSAVVEEIHGTLPSDDDVLMICKRFMADTDPYKVVVVVSAAQAEVIRRNFCQPVGISERRVISAKVKQNISTKIRPCVSQGSLTLEAAAYLSNWVDGTLIQKERPASYAFLRHRNDGADVAVDGDGEAWVAPRRDRHIDLQCPGEEVEYFSESDADDEGEVELAAIDDE